MDTLLPKERELYDYICERIRRDGYAPTVRDICQALDIKSTSTAHSYIAKLEAKGYIHRAQGKSRTMRVEQAPRETQRTVKIPVLGKVAAGLPILAVENCEGYIDFPVMNRSQLYGELFGLRVEGESMIDAGIFSGDIVIVQKEHAANNGDIVVALVEDEATVKRFYKENGHFRLQPENKSMEPIIVNEVYILGKVQAVIRYYRNY
ncbi:MAG: transcriptional repressor LexA [Ruminococcaceae bacterium]|nr:transcriptional repressor LexA [Oscillospiraceae bacterium]